MSVRWLYCYVAVIAAMLFLLEDVQAFFKIAECTPVYTTKITPCRQKIRKWYVMSCFDIFKWN